jgi:hypothetical protein
LLTTEVLFLDNRDKILEKFYSIVDKELLKDYILTVFGPESKTLAENYQISDEILLKYEHCFCNNIESIKGKTIIDLGCGHGLWMLLALLHGAKKVVGLEPRGMFVVGFNQFCKKHKLNGQMFQGTDINFDTTFSKTRADTIFLFSVVDVVFDIEKLFYVIGKQQQIKNIVCQMLNVCTDKIDFSEYPSIKKHEIMGITIHVDGHNSDLRSTINRFHPMVNEKTGLQTTVYENFDIESSVTTRHIPSVEYICALAQRYNYDITFDLTQPEPVANSSLTYQTGSIRWISFSK